MKWIERLFHRWNISWCSHCNHDTGKTKKVTRRRPHGTYGTIIMKGERKEILCCKCDGAHWEWDGFYESTFEYPDGRVSKDGLPRWY